MRVSTSGLIFLTAAFPFVIPLSPATDTQPTFSLFALAFALVAIVQCFDRNVLLERSHFVLAATLAGGGIIWLGASLAVNDFATDNPARIVSFAMFLIALAAGLLNQQIFTAWRITTALKLYVFFTLLFFATRGALEGLLIQSRGEEALSGLLLTGRGASTLSPEPSFFAFQIFTLFLAARLTVWDQLDRRGRHFVQLTTIGLLLASFAGYGVLYAAVVIFLAGWRYMLPAVVFGGLGLVALVNVLDIDSLRFVRLFTSLALSLADDNFKVTDVSTLGRLNSFLDYLQAFLANPMFGDGFRLYGGGGLVSLMGALGLYGLTMVVLIVAAILLLRAGVKLKIALLFWFALQFISGPIGLPLLGVMAGLVMARSRLSTLVTAVDYARARRRAARAASDSFA